MAQSSTTRTTKHRALVLGGGGLAGIAWETGVLAGLAAEGVDVTDADLIVGTSAGSTVAAQLRAGLTLTELHARQTDPALQTRELVPTGMTLAETIEIWISVYARTSDPIEIARLLGDMALTADTLPEAVRRAVIADRLPSHAWPPHTVLIVAVDAHTGLHRVFDRDSGVPLVDAVTASCAVPGIWPPVTIGTTRWVDGGVRSANNADLAADHERVLVLAPMPDPTPDQARTRPTGPDRVEVIRPDGPSRTAFGADPLDPDVRTPAGRAGHAQGRELAPLVTELWAG